MGIIVTIVVCVVGFFIMKPLVGFLALRRDPISAGQTYLKRSFLKVSPAKAALISDEAYKQLAKKAFQFAEFSHAAENQSLFGCYMSQLDFYVLQIELILKGEETDLDGPVGEVLKKYGGPIPKATE